MKFRLGIDTGGTYTDAVLLDEAGQVHASAKALTTPAELERGIAGALDGLPAGLFDAIELASLSTTLATNAVVEGHGGRVCLLLIGYPRESLALENLGQVLGGDSVEFAAGGHDEKGDELAPLDEAALAGFASAHAGQCEAFAVSGYFSVRNPGHENRAREIVRALTGKPVTCGHELSSNLNAPRRAVTTVWNARLVPLLTGLIRAVKAMLEARGIRAPLSVVKGDGSLMSAEHALEYPVQCILSGPAASAVGAVWLSGLNDALVADIGGTTTDVAVIRGGLPAFDPEGAEVGGVRTMIQAVRMHTSGLGGDSEVGIDEDGRLKLGPRRVVPLCLLAAEHPGVGVELASRLDAEPRADDGRFVLAMGDAFRRAGYLSRMESFILERCASGPVGLAALAREADSRWLLMRDLDRLVRRGLLGLAGFSPSDAAHVLGLQTGWSAEAAGLGARLVARRLGLGLDGRAAAALVLERLYRDSAAAVWAACLAEEQGIQAGRHAKLMSVLSAKAFGPADAGELFGVKVELKRPLVAIGAPAAAYYPEVGRLLGARVVVPPHAEVANAVGAVVGRVVQRVLVLVVPLEEGFRVHHPAGVRDFPDLDSAAGFAEAAASAEAERRARLAGALRCELRVERKDVEAAARDGTVFLETRIQAVASGFIRISSEFAAGEIKVDEA